MKKRIYLLFIFTISFLFGFLLSQKPTYAAAYYHPATFSNITFTKPNLSFDVTSDHYLNPSTIVDASVYSNDDSQTVWCTTVGGLSQSVNKSSGTIHINITDLSSDVNNAGDCASIPDGNLSSGYIIEINDASGSDVVRITSAFQPAYMTGQDYPWPTPTPSEVNLTTEQKASVAAALKSIPDTAVSEVFAVYPIVLPYAILIVALMIFWVMWRMMKNYNNSKNDPENTNTNTIDYYEMFYKPEYDREIAAGFSKEEASKNADAFSLANYESLNNGSD